MHGGDHLGPEQGPRRRADARDRRSAVRRARDRHRASSSTRTRRPTSHRMAADLLEHGVEVHEIFRRLYENVPLAQARSCWRGCCRASSATTTAGSPSPTSCARTTRRPGADENYSEGIVDHIRALEGTVVAALVREQLKEGRDGVQKVSLRAVRRRGRRERDRPRGGRRRPPPGGRLLHRRAPARS